MALEFGKAVKASLLPMAGVVVIGIIGAVLGLVPYLSCLVGIPLMLVTIVVLGWGGFRAAKTQGMDVVGGALTGLIAGAIGGLIVGIIGAILSILGIAAGAAMGSGIGAVGAGIGIVASIVGIVIGVIFWAILGAIAGAIGAYIAGMKK